MASAAASSSSSSSSPASSSASSRPSYSTVCPASLRIARMEGLPTAVFDISGRGRRLDTADDAAFIVHALRELPEDLLRINLSGNTFGVEASKAVAAVLATKQSIHECLFNDIFTGRLRSETPDSIGALTSALVGVDVRLLDLSDNAFGPAGAIPLQTFLSQTPTLRELRLNNNGLGSEGGLAVAKALSQLAARNKERSRPSTLTSFSAGRNRLEDAAAPALAEALSQHVTLEAVRFPQNGIRANGISALVSSLQACSNLRHLDLQDNTLTRVGATALARALKSWPALTSLNLGDCLVSAAGGCRIANALRKSGITRLTHLYLGYNELDDSAISAFVPYIRTFGSALCKLELNGNRADPDGVALSTIRAALEDCGAGVDILDELDDMEPPSSSDEEAEDSEESEEAASDSDSSACSDAEDDDEEGWEHVSKPTDIALSTTKSNDDEVDSALASALAKMSI